MYSPQAQMYERSREAAFALGIALHKGVKVAQYDELCEQDQRDCIDCIGHRWVPGQRRGTCHPATMPPCHPATREISSLHKKFLVCVSDGWAPR